MMARDDEELTFLNDGHWRVLPRWVKVISVGVGLPAWLVLVTLLFTDHLGGTVFTATFGIFAAVAALQMAFIFRAYWRMDL